MLPRVCSKLYLETALVSTSANMSHVSVQPNHRARAQAWIENIAESTLKVEHGVRECSARVQEDTQVRQSGQARRGVRIQSHQVGVLRPRVWPSGALESTAGKRIVSCARQSAYSMFTICAPEPQLHQGTSLTLRQGDGEARAKV